MLLVHQILGYKGYSKKYLDGLQTKTALIAQSGFHIPPDVNSLLRWRVADANAAWMV